MLVALFHFRTQSHIEELALIRNAHLFVDFFFVLSGFVVTYAYIGRLGTGSEVGIMVWRRFARLWPLHAFMLLAFIAFELGSELMSLITGAARSVELFDPNSASRLSAIPTNLLLIHSLGIHDSSTWNIPSWSISTEFWTYIVFAISVRLAGKRSAYMAVMFACFAASLLIASTTRLSASQHDFGLFRCIYGFFVGYLAFTALNTTPAWLSRWIGTFAEILTAAGVLAFVACFGFSKISFAAPLVFGVAVWIFAHGNGLISRLLQWRPIALLGVWSYSIYMVHALVITCVNKIVNVASVKLGVPLFDMVPTYGEINPVINFGGAWVMDLLVMAYLAMIIGLSALLWRFIEMPMQRWLNDRMRLENGRLRWLGFSQQAPQSAVTHAVAGAKGVP